ncbi:MAG: hypothetical protein HFE84_02680 [Lachnospiraceae bacterium]|jgi:uncharacterized membrane protein|nr:hypothetical protein [Lachnospiraceae bacterium]
MKMRVTVREFLESFLKCGVAGWCMEILFTSMESAAGGDWRLLGHTSLLMFPIYGLGALLGPICGMLDKWLGDAENLARWDKFWRHGIHDMVLIFMAEYGFGSLLRLAGACPWDYTGRMLNVDGLIRLDFAPCWFGAGLFFEGLSRKKERDAIDKISV